jgi:hypothetical protein
MTDCIKNKLGRIVIPKPEKNAKGQLEIPKVMFRAIQKCLPVPFVVYADFETILRPLHGPLTKTQSDPTVSNTRKYNVHDPMSFAVYVKSKVDDSYLTGIENPYVYRGPNAAVKFLEHMNVIATRINELYDLNTKMNPLTQQQEIDFARATKCYICTKPIEESEVKVRDHCHITGMYRGAAHSNCNLNYQNPDILPVFFHNLSGYDSKFIVKALGRNHKDITVIPNNEEKYISFSYKVKGLKVQYVDTFRFLGYGLDTLAGNLPKDRFHVVEELFKKYPPEKRNLMKEKGEFPYSYVTSEEKLLETSLPAKEAFYNDLKLQHISDERYNKAVRLWDAIGFENLGAYSDHYLLQDVGNLADVFENFRNTYYKNHGLDPAWYFTLPGLAWDAALKLTGVELDLITNDEIFFLIESSIRGGICQVSKRYAETTDGVRVVYFDANNLYGLALSDFLPTGDFELIDDPHDIAQLGDIMNLPDDGEKGYFFLVDVKYPEHLHDKHNDLPFLPEKMAPPGAKQEKLLTTLYDKKNYLVHYRSLKQALANGLEIEKIHKVIKFSQSRWLKPFIDKNTQLRQEADNEADRDLHKLNNNAVYGKSMENKRLRIIIELVNNERRLRKLIANPRFIDRIQLNEKLVAIRLAPTKIYMDKPLYIGAAVLDISKHTMYDFHYQKMKEFYGEALQLVYMDTDSFIYEIKTNNLFADMRKNLEWFDTSNYEKSNPAWSNKNHKVPGKFKDETAGRVIRRVIALRPKMYLIDDEGVIKKRAKGVQTCALKTQITAADYERCLFEGVEKMVTFNRIMSKHHCLYTVAQQKIALTSNDNKRSILPDKIHTKAYGHYSLNIVEPMEIDLTDD